MILKNLPKEIGPTIRLIPDKDGNIIDSVLVHSTENGNLSQFVTTK